MASAGASNISAEDQIRIIDYNDPEVNAILASNEHTSEETQAWLAAKAYPYSTISTNLINNPSLSYSAQSIIIRKHAPPLLVPIAINTKHLEHQEELLRLSSAGDSVQAGLSMNKNIHEDVLKELYKRNGQNLEILTKIAGNPKTPEELQLEIFFNLDDKPLHLALSRNPALAHSVQGLMFENYDKDSIIIKMLKNNPNLSPELAAVYLR